MRVVRGWWLCTAMFFGACQGQCQELTAQGQELTAGTYGGEECNLKLVPVTDAGMLPACAAGKSTPTGPGLPFDFKGTVEQSMPMSEADVAAAAAADALSTARNSTPQSQVDRGFGVAPGVHQ